MISNTFYDRHVPHNELYNEAQNGNIDYIRSINQRLGYVQYDQCITHAALRKHQYKFWREFVRLSKSSLSRENYPWDARIQIFTDLFMEYRGPDEFLFSLFRPLYDGLLLSGTNLSSCKASELEGDLCLALALHPPRRCILEFLVERKDFRFKMQHLELAQLAFDRDLVQYVRERIHPDCVQAKALQLVDPEPNDSDLVCLILDAVRIQYFWCSYDIVVQFLVNYPAMIDKMYFLIEYLQNILDEQNTAMGESSSNSDNDECSGDTAPDEQAPSLFYRQDLAQQLIGGVLDPESETEVPGYTTTLPLEAKAPPMSRSPKSVWSRPPGTPVPWLDTQLRQRALHSPTVVQDTQFMCQLVCIMLDQVYPGLQRWDLVKDHEDVGQVIFEPNCVPSRARFLSSRRFWFRDLRTELIQLDELDWIECD